MSTVYYIGGASAAGKSTIAASLATEHGIPMIRLDDFYNALGREAELTGEVLCAATKAVSFELATQLLSSGSTWILEGGWINPKEVCQLQEKGDMVAIFAGYPNAKPEDRLAALSGHWLKQKPEAEALKFLAEQIRSSKTHYHAECEFYDIAFVDCGDFSVGTNEITQFIVSEIDKRSVL